MAEGHGDASLAADDDADGAEVVAVAADGEDDGADLVESNGGD